MIACFSIGLESRRDRLGNLSPFHPFIILKTRIVLVPTFDPDKTIFFEYIF